MASKQKNIEFRRLTVGGGCFWCTEAVFRRVMGVVKVIPGYSGGDTKNPTYRQITTGRTGHAEVVQITYDPEVVSLKELLEIFFTTHDPTTLNRQGADIGTHYRSIILFEDKEQRNAAETVIQEFNKKKIYPNPIVTELKELSKFYEAEEYHKDYYDKNPIQPYCRMVINPKLSKLQEKFSDKLKS
jgi:peptide-methionine (S)-S-oxide reductase